MDEFEIVELLNSLEGLTIECPNCRETFAARKGHLFDVRKPYPRIALRTLTQQQDNIKRTHKHIDRERAVLLRKLDGLRKKQKELKHRRVERPKQVQIITKRVNIGQIVEKILPSTTKFSFETRDCRTLLTPIDYVSFTGLTRQGKVESISFIEIKTGNSGLQGNQKKIKEIVEDGKLRLAEY